jgi:hypothetical protein
LRKGNERKRKLKKKPKDPGKWSKDPEGKRSQKSKFGDRGVPISTK